jgi:hypothetical protein
MPDDETTAFAYSRPAMLRLVMIASLLTLLSMIAAFQLVPNMPRRPYLEVGGFLGLFFFGVMIPIFLARLFQTGPVIEIGGSGIRDRRVSDDVMAWENVERLRTTKDRGQFFLRVHLRAPSQLRRTLLNRIVSGGASHVSINMAGLKGSFDDLVDAVRRYRQVEVT